MRKLRIDQINYVGKRVLMRVDYNVPMEDGKIASNQRIVASLKSIKYILKRYCQALILITHLGRPDGKRVEKYSLVPVWKELQRLLKKDVVFLDDCVGPKTEMAVMEPEEGTVFLLENARFHIEEIGVTSDGKKKADPKMVVEFRKSLRRLAEIYINEAFGVSHHNHSSMVGDFYEVRAAGFLVLKEMDFFSEGLREPNKPFLAILGGARLKDKVKLIDALLSKVTEMIIAGGIVFTFLKVHKNSEIGESLFDVDGAEYVPKLMKKAEENRIQIHFPIDFMIAKKNDKEAVARRAGMVIPKGYMGLDIGPRSLKEFARIIRRAKILLWNGPVGAHEMEQFSAGTREMTELIVDQTNAKGITIVSGDETELALEKYGAANKVSYVSTGSEATLELLKGNPLPGINALCDEDVNCRQRCKQYQVIRPQLEDNPFGEVDVDIIRGMRRREREDLAEKIAQEQKEKSNSVPHVKPVITPTRSLGSKATEGSRASRQSRGSKKSRTSTQTRASQGSSGDRGSRGDEGSKSQQGSRVLGSKASKSSRGDSLAYRGSRASKLSNADRGSRVSKLSNADRGSRVSKVSNAERGSKLEMGSMSAIGSQSERGSTSEKVSKSEKGSKKKKGSKFLMTLGKGKKGSKSKLKSWSKKGSKSEKASKSEKGSTSEE